MTRPDWDQWSLAIAEVVATRADCTRSKVGAVILSKRNRIIGQGYNGTLPGVPGCLTAGNCPRGRMSYEEVAANSDYSNCIARHAEENAIEDALEKGVPVSELREATLYATRKPCPACTTLIAAVGIGRVVVRGEENTEC
ncbi:deoxycytidylate deaminase [Streptomyces phage RedBear]|nr:deoxycytidylate deaminase [Streptomyces phage RedBear]QZE10736.1 deoxycytidylate deaminase [Streptomyces phage Katalie]QZE11030.1 deoxycytidylate deaminase [Streptomyces phage South40]